MTVAYDHLLLAFGINVVAISLLTYAMYFRRHQRRDLTLGLMGVNVGLFAVSAFTTGTTISVGFGIGLFALLSVIRLRSTQTSQEEIGYYFVALVIGIVNGLAVDDHSWGIALMLDAMLLGVMFVADHPRLLHHAERRIVRLEGAIGNKDELWREMEERLGFEVTGLRVLELDYARKRTRVDVRFRSDRPVRVHRDTEAPAATAPGPATEPPPEPRPDPEDRP